MRNYPATVGEGLKPVECLAWHKHGRKFMSSHSDGTIMSWTQDNNSKDDSQPVNQYGEHIPLGGGGGGFSCRPAYCFPDPSWFHETSQEGSVAGRPRAESLEVTLVGCL